MFLFVDCTDSTVQTFAVRGVCCFRRSFTFDGQYHSSLDSCGVHWKCIARTNPGIFSSGRAGTCPSRCVFGLSSRRFRCSHRETLASSKVLAGMTETATSDLTLEPFKVRSRLVHDKPRIQVLSTKREKVFFHADATWEQSLPSLRIPVWPFFLSRGAPKSSLGETLMFTCRSTKADVS